MTIKRTLFDIKSFDKTSTTKFTQDGVGMLSGQVSIFWPLTADGTFGASISTKVVGYEYVLSDGTINQLATLEGAPKTGMTVSIVADDKQNSKRVILVTNTGTVGIVQINVVQEDLPWWDSRLTDVQRFETVFNKLADLETRVAALEAAAP